MRPRLLQALSVFSTGLLAGAFGYGAANLVPTFNTVPIEMRLDFHTALMTMNGITVQGAMAVSALGSFALAVAERGRARVLAGAAGLLVVSSFLITRFGNVPINGRIKQWAATVPPAGHEEVLRRWELFNNARTLTAAVAFGLLVLLALRPHRRPAVASAPQQAGRESLPPRGLPLPDSGADHRGGDGGRRDSEGFGIEDEWRAVTPLP
ncbi:DUF1772 domain-containing protein [Streptomyces sp. BR123]|nr:DUF1772 domain-containing protein [Streptomyces sp. BR123]